MHILWAATGQVMRRSMGSQSTGLGRFFCWVNINGAWKQLGAASSAAGVKRCRIVKEVFRNTKAGFSDLVMEVACALHNLGIDCRHPLPAFSVGQLASG